MLLFLYLINRIEIILNLILFFISAGKAQDDIVLEIVIFLGTAAYDEDCARLLCKADILLSLIELLKGMHVLQQTKKSYFLRICETITIFNI